MKNNKFIYFIITLFYILLTFSCFKKNQEITKEESAQIPEYVILEEEKLKDSKIFSQEVQPSEFKETIKLVGEVQANPDRIFQISSVISGRVKKVSFIPGSYVKKDSPLVEIESLEASRLRSKYFTSYSRYQAALKNLNRLRELGKLKLTSEQEIINSESEVKVLEGELKADLGNLKILKIEAPDFGFDPNSSSIVVVRSPISGTALSRNVIVGEEIQPNQNLGLIGDISEVWFVVKIFEKDLAKLQEGIEAKIQLNSYPNEIFTGRLTYIGSIVDPKTRNVEGRIVLKNPKHIAKLGLYGTASLEIITYDVLSVKKESLIRYQNKDYVFIEEAPGKYKMQEVKIGRVSEDQVEILSGLFPSEYVVYSGMYILKALFLKSSFGED